MKTPMIKGLSIGLLIFCTVYCASAATQTAGKKNHVAINVGVVYEEGSLIGKMGLDCIEIALSDLYKSPTHYYKTRLVLHTRVFPKGSVVGAAAAALNLIKYAKVVAILGPTTSMEAEFVTYLGEKAEVPIISYSATSPLVSPNQSPYFVRAAQDDLFQVKPLRDLVQAFGWREVVPIYVDDNFGAGLLPSLDDALQQIDVSIPYRWALPLLATDDQIREELYKLETMQTRVFIVHMAPELASRLFLIVHELEMMNKGYVWITTTAISNELGSLDPSVLESMQGVLGVRTFVPETKELKDFYRQFDRKNPDSMKPSVMGLWAYDAASALARAVEQVGAPNSVTKKKKNTASSQLLTDLDSFDVCPIGQKLLKAIHNISFIGLAGNFSLKGGLLESSTYQVINVLGTSGSRDIGFWTPKTKLVRNLNSGRRIAAPLSGSNSELRAVIWPGETTITPKGWEIPTSGKTFIVGVPVKYAYQDLVKVTLNGSTDAPVASGFCIDVFDAVMKSLPYAVPYRYKPFAKPDGSPAGSYDDLVYSVHLKTYDVVVGDITIIANRSSYVDFTLPFTESGVTMVVPVKKEKPKSAWIFLKPLTRSLWVATFGAFVSIAFVIWIFEHRVNEEFRGPPCHQAGTSLFYSFSMMVFAQKENVLSNLSRFVVVTWVFVVLILTQSYTASLTSMLTVQQLRPTVTDVNELIRNGAYVSYQEETFVRGLLIGMGFHESKLIPYNTSSYLDELLSKESTNGGIAAVFDELPYMRLFLAEYPSKYTMVQPTYKTGGFGFAFPKGSPLVSDVSSAILRVTEGDRMKTIENAWGMSQFNTPDEKSTESSSDSLGLDSFWGLFLIAGGASGFALIIFIVTFLNKHRDIWRFSGASIWSKIRTLARVFDQQDMESHTFRRGKGQCMENSKGNEAGVDEDNDENAAVQITPKPESPPRPSNYYSDETEAEFTFSGVTIHPCIQLTQFAAAEADMSEEETTITTDTENYP